MIQNIRPTSKAALKMQCLYSCGGDIDKAAKLYEFMIKDMENLPMFDVQQPTTMQQIKDCTTSVLPSGSGISVALRLVLMPDVAVPEFSEALQKNVKDTVEGLAGVEVNNVSVLIVEPPKQNVRNASAQ